MRILKFFIGLCTLTGLAQKSQPESQNLAIVSKDFIVKGNTSIGKFDCKTREQLKDTLFLNQPLGLSDKIAVADFGCGNFMIKRDFRKTLNADSYPHAYFALEQVQDIDGRLVYNLSVTIAGVCKKIENLSFTQQDGVLMSKVDLKFSDFNLTPPKKLGGAIKIEEDIELLVHLVLK